MTRSSEPQLKATDEIEKEMLIQEMMHQVANVQKKFQAEGEDDERRWMISNANDSEVIAFLKESTVMMLHVIDAIGELEPVNGISISKQFGFPRGSVSKITRKLAELKMVRSESLPDNKKEVLFHLTELGRKVYLLHKKLHFHIGHNVRNFLNRYELEQMRFLVQCMKDTSEASWVEGESVDERPPATNPDRLTAPAIADRAPQEAIAIGEILALLQQLDARNLKKAKAVIQAAFFD